ncbi:hypothetical protein E2562_000264 [Oryza meyeriana var. granulata]|uniref:Uncharacterized protein n=1 Tax=Oryza meyeriana var. granulata TaxID=110450 RepID=A0A6G1CP14_9ORYZ|nr:hypothetical protein E2562_000264 [Oryza meyeriana var. granulata]
MPWKLAKPRASDGDDGGRRITDPAAPTLEVADLVYVPREEAPRGREVASDDGGQGAQIGSSLAAEDLSAAHKLIDEQPDLATTGYWEEADRLCPQPHRRQVDNMIA